MPVLKSELRTLIIGSRGSQLALWQANHVADNLSRIGVTSRIEIIKTTGDHLQTASLLQAGGKGLFTKEIEEALLNGSIDLAVHSLKDLPTENPKGLTIAAIPPREDPRDAIVGCSLGKLRQGARVGTSSGRRRAQLLALRSDLCIEAVRGNVDTRIRKLREGQYDAIVLAAAGLKRLGMEHEISGLFSPEQICPAPGQGALALQTRVDDPAQSVCAELNDQGTSECVRCERATLAALGGGCQVPVGVYARSEEGRIEALAVVASLDGRSILREKISTVQGCPDEIGSRLAEQLLRRGADSILAGNDLG